MPKKVVSVSLNIVVEGATGQQLVDRATQAVHEALKRKCLGMTTHGPDVIRGLETFQQDDPVKLPGGAMATLHWSEYEVEERADVPATSH